MTLLPPFLRIAIFNRIRSKKKAHGSGRLLRCCRLLGVGALAALGPAFLAGCSHAPSAIQSGKTIEVDVTRPIGGEVTDYTDFTGRLDAVKTVDIRARVTGYVTQAPFKEGDRVKEGDLLFEIDPRTYAADLNAAEANVKLAEADSKLLQ
jgi:multidrug efflux pump subunit AcrA (membrane-fusion protein)